MKIIYRKQAGKMLRAMPLTQATSIQKAIERLAKSPDDPFLDIKSLVNRPEFRLRVGKWRVIFMIEDKSLKIERIAARGSVY